MTNLLEHIKKLLSVPGDYPAVDVILSDLLKKAHGVAETINKPDNSSFGHVEKRGVKMGFSWESVVPGPKGHYEPIGIKWVQKIGWLWGLLLFKAHSKLEKSLNKTRHFNEVSGYDYDEASYDDFEQKTKWIKDEEETA